MRQIPDQLLELIAGGGACDTSTSCVEIPGTGGGGGPIMDPYPYDPSPFNPGGDYGGGGGGGSEPGPCHHSSPAPALKPAHVSLDELRDALKDVANKMIAKGVDKIEHGAVISLTADGHLKTSPIVDGDPKGNGNTVVYQPVAGETLVAWIHSHPVRSNDQTIPSSPGNAAMGEGKSDIETARQLLKYSFTDPGALMVIVDGKSKQAYEYTMAGPDIRTTGPSITNDTGGC